MIPDHLQPFNAPADTRRGGRTIDLSFMPHPWQERAMRCIGQPDFRALIAVIFRQGGKTELALRTLLVDALRRPGLRAYIAPQRITAKNVAWPRLKALVRSIPGTEIREADLQVSFPCPTDPSQVSTIGLFGATDEEGGSSVRGLTIVGAVLDELAQQPHDFVQSAFLPTQSAVKNPWFIGIGTPRGRADALYEMYEKANTIPGWYSLAVPITEGGVHTPDQIAAMRPMFSENSWHREQLVSFDVGTEDQMLKDEHILSARQRTVGEHERRELRGTAAMIGGLDLGFQGDDRSVLAVRQGPVLLEVISFPKTDTYGLALRINNLVHKYELEALFVDAGAGGHTFNEVLRNLGVFSTPVSFGGKPNDPAYLNKRAEMYDAMRRWIERDDASIPDDHKLHREMAATKYKMTTNGKLQLEPKADVKKRIGVSPDQADAIALTFAARVLPIDFYSSANEQLSLIPPRSASGDRYQSDYDAVRNRRRNSVVLNETFEPHED